MTHAIGNKSFTGTYKKNSLKLQQVLLQGEASYTQ